MNYITICLLFCLIMFPVGAFGGEANKIELTDGGVIIGEIISQSDTGCVVRSDSMGVVNLKRSDIRRVQPLDPAASEQAPTTHSPAGTPDIQQLQNAITNNKEIMGLVLALQNDPEIQALLADPEIMSAVQAGDVSGLMSNPKFMRILNNARVREIQEKVLSQNPEGN